MNWRSAVIMVCPTSAIFMAATVLVSAQQSDEPRFGRGPWVFVERDGKVEALPRMQFDGRPSGAVRILLDDGREGVVRVDSDPCTAGERCAAADCGCLESDRFRLSVIDSAGKPVATAHLWAAYGMFDIIPADLAVGPGDELLIVRPLGRSAPPNGMDLKILEIAGGSIRELLATHQIAGNLSGTPMVCGEWRARVTVDSQGRKPRSLFVTHDVIVPSGCTLGEPEEAAARRRQKTTLVMKGERYVAR